MGKNVKYLPVIFIPQDPYFGQFDHFLMRLFLTSHKKVPIVYVAAVEHVVFIRLFC